MTDLSLVRALPAFAAELEEGLRKEGREDFAAQVAALPIVERCRCGDSFCATFYTAAKLPITRPGGGCWPDCYSLEVESLEGWILVDLVDEKIRGVEVLYRPDVQKALFAVLP